MTTTTHPPVPESTHLRKRIIRARLQVARTTSDLEHATMEHKFASENLAALEAEERAVRAVGA